jgi:hypothetical protein
MNKPTILMFKCIGGLNPGLRPDKLDKILKKKAKFSSQCYFFDSPKSASEALKEAATLLHPEDEFFLIPVDASADVLAHCCDTSTTELNAVGLSAFYVPFVTPGKGDEQSGTQATNQPLR